jgi:hypothetical protein
MITLPEEDAELMVHSANAGVDKETVKSRM